MAHHHEVLGNSATFSLVPLTLLRTPAHLSATHIHTHPHPEPSSPPPLLSWGKRQPQLYLMLHVFVRLQHRYILGSVPGSPQLTAGESEASYLASLNFSFLFWKSLFFMVVLKNKRYNMSRAWHMAVLR